MPHEQWGVSAWDKCSREEPSKPRICRYHGWVTACGSPSSWGDDQRGGRDDRSNNHGDDWKVGWGDSQRDDLGQDRDNCCTTTPRWEDDRRDDIGGDDRDATATTGIIIITVIIFIGTVIAIVFITIPAAVPIVVPIVVPITRVPI